MLPRLCTSAASLIVRRGMESLRRECRGSRGIRHRSDHRETLRPDQSRDQQDRKKQSPPKELHRLHPPNHDQWRAATLGSLYRAKSGGENALRWDYLISMVTTLEIGRASCR